MKTIPVQEAQGKLGQLIAEACRGEVIVLTDGDKRVTLEPGVPLDLEEDSPELEAELLNICNWRQFGKTRFHEYISQIES